MFQAAFAELDEVRFSFARPHGEWALAGVELGLRRFNWCDRRLRRIEHKPSYASDLHTQINVRALRARMLLAQQRAAEAVHVTIDDFRNVRRLRCTASILRRELSLVRWSEKG